MATRLSKLASDVAPARVPPHNLEAEESVLGACMLSRQAIATALETVGPDDFYKPAHTEMFRIMLDLYARGEPLDAVTLGEELKRRGNLDEFGGKPYLFTLVSSVPSPGAVGHYARIVQENATLRRLVDAGQQITDIGFALPEDVEEAVDQAEDLVYQVANRRVSEDLVILKDLLTENMEMVEKLYERGSAITGVATGFNDLDDLTAGLQPSNLIIVAARPSMGKALALDTPIPTPAGWTTIGQIQPGARVFDDRGQVCRVEAASAVYPDHACYEVELDDGSVIVADAGHQWLAWEYPGWRAQRRVVTTAQMLAGGVQVRVARTSHPRWRVPLAGPLDLPELPLPLDPYVLGCRLGDAHSVLPGGAGRGLERSPFPGGYKAAVATAGPGDQHPMQAPGRRVGLLERAANRVPDAYLRGSFKQRLALLQGLMDMAGAVNDAGCRVELCLSDEELLAQVRELVCSLGHKPGPVHERTLPDGGAVAGVAWRFRWNPLDPVFRLAPMADALAATARGRGRPRGRGIVAIRPVAPVPVRCIQVDSSSRLYLAGESLVPTHNSALALSIAQHVATSENVPVVIFSLEMSKMELVQRLMCSEARVDSNRLRRGALQDSDWPKLSLALGRLAEAPIFIDDTPNATIMEMRAKCRRVASKSGLGLVIIDYLQLMAPLKRTDNRVQEVSEISRSLKILARELDVPVIALSQLSRNVEYRADKRPLLADLRESGCVTAQTRLLRADTGAEVSFGELMATGERPVVWALDEHLRMVPRPVEKVFPSGVKEVFRVELASGRSVEATANHPFLTIGGWMPLRELTAGTRVGVPRSVPEPLHPVPMPEPAIVLLAHLIGDGSFAKRQPVPEQVFSLPNDQVALFLRHLWATDGCVGRDERGGMGGSYYTSTSKRLIEDVSRLLLRFGILSGSKRISKRGYRDCWRLNITAAPDQLRFVERMGVHGASSLSSRKAPSREGRAKSAVALQDPELERFATADVFWDEILVVQALGAQSVFDATISNNHNFIADGINLHNSIEQDADVVMFIYRDEVYHQDSPQRGIAEIHISKHRSGPIGKVELTFLEHYTKFANLARGM